MDSDQSSPAGDRALCAVSTVALWMALWMWIGNSQQLATLYSAIMSQV